MTRLKRRETQVSIVRAAITYLGFGLQPCSPSAS